MRSSTFSEKGDVGTLEDGNLIHFMYPTGSEVNGCSYTYYKKSVSVSF
jgi:hypothetical protein